MGFDASVAIGSKFDASGVDKAKVGLKELGEAATKIGELLLSAFAAEKIFEFGKNILETGEQLDLMRQKTGISVEAIDSLRIAAELNGIAFDSLGAGLRKFNVAISDAAHGGKNASDAFKALQIGAVSSKTSSELLFEVADKFKLMSDGADKAKIATLLFGKAGSDLIPVLNEGRDGLQKYSAGFTGDFASRAHAFNDTLTLIGESSKKIGVEALGQMLPAVQEVARAFLDLENNASGGKESFQNIAEGFRLTAIAGYGLAVALEDGFDFVFTLLNNVGEAIGAVASSFVQGATTLAETASEIAHGHFQDALNTERAYASSSLDVYKSLTASRDKNDVDYVQRVQDRQKKLADFTSSLAKNSLVLGDGTRDQILARQASDTKTEPRKAGTNFDTDALKQSIDPQLKAIEELRAEISKTTDSFAEYKLKLSETNDEYAKNKNIVDGNADATKKTIGFTRENTAAYKDLEEQLVAVKNAQIDFATSQKESFGAGAQEAFHDYLEAARDVAAQSKQLFSQAFAGMEDAIVKFVQTGKLSFTDLANTIEADLIRLAIRQAAVAAVGGSSSIIGSIFSSAATSAAGSAASSGASSAGYSLGTSTDFGSYSFANGGIMTQFGEATLRKYAGGGIANSPQVALYGEGSKPEAFVPLPDGRSIPVTMKGGQGQQGGNVVNINVAVNNDGSTTSNSDGAAQGKALANVISIAVTSELIKQKRPGGLLA